MVIEEDLHVVDVAGRELAPRAAELLDREGCGAGAEVVRNCVVRVATVPARTAAELRSGLRTVREGLNRAGSDLGLAVVAAGSVPLMPPGSALVDESPSTRRLLADYEFLARDQIYGGSRIRVRARDADEAVRVAGRIARFLPVFLALTASSPFLRDGSDSGYSSCRSVASTQWPTTGPVAGARSAAEYAALVDDLVASGVIADASLVAFGVQPGADGRSVELLVGDACPSADATVLAAALFRALVEREAAAVAAGAEVTPPAETRLRAALWRAARSGLEGDLVDPVSFRPRPASDVVSELVDALADELTRAGDLGLVRTLLDNALYNGSSAFRQRQTLRRRGQFPDVVDLLVTETAGASGPRSAVAEAHARLFGVYEPVEGLDADPSWDEAVEEGGAPRADYTAVMEVLDRVGTVRLRSRQVMSEQEASVAGVTFRVTGQQRPQAFPMDFVPRIITPTVWAELSAGIEQRARALDAFLDDIYGEREFVRAGHLVPEDLDRAPGHRGTGRVQPPGRTRAHICGIDLVCGDDGRWFVLEDNVRVPSGIAFSHALRQMTTSLFGDLTGGVDLHSPDQAFPMIRETLQAAAPPAAGDDPQLAVVSSGPSDSAWFEHRLIATRTGLPLVTPDRLTFRDGVLHHHDGRRLHRVDVLYARIDEDMLLSSPGFDGTLLRDDLLEAIGGDRLTVANALGNGVADDKAVYSHVPAMIDFYLGEKPLLDQVPTYLCADRTQRDLVLDRLGELVVKPIDGYGGLGITIGPECSEAELAARREDLLTRPEGFIAQEVVPLSTLPTFDGTRMQRRHVDLRAFAHVRTEGGRTTAHAVPAGLTRVAPAGSMIVNSSRGGGGKDTWILR